MMDFLKDLLDRLINPRSRLERLGSLRHLPEGAAPAGARGRARFRDVVFNAPLMVGMLVCLALFLLVLFGPVWAPQNPYVSAQHIVPHYDVQRKETIQPPLYPSPEYPLGTDRWGNDLLSMLMHGARNTLVACSFVTMVRVLLGLTLGGIAGWNEGRPADQIVMGVSGVITSVPTLISSIILIYALDIRKGLPVFILALSAIGWTEIAQYIRGEFLVLRNKPYIEGARASGLDGLAIAVRHVLPNVLPQLLVITFLEMGAVMMLLGELGFVGVYIGGGSRISIETDPFVYETRTLIEIPEWGAMLADGYRWLRSRPFVIMPPAIAFFVSVLGFNSLGEGLRHLVERKSLDTAFLLRKRMLLAVAGLALATVFIINNTGPAPWFAKVASAFDGDQAYEHVRALAAMGGRGVGQRGALDAAAYIAARFQEYGLEPGWKNSSYDYPLDVRLVRPAAQPYLALLADGQPARVFRHQLDFGFVTQGHGGSGDVQAPLTFVGFWPDERGHDRESFRGLDLRGRIVILLEGNAPPDFAVEAMIRGARGILWIVGEGETDIRSQFRIADQESLRSPSLPIFRVRSAAADAILGQAGVSLADLYAQNGAWDRSGPGWFTRELPVTVRMSLSLGEVEDVEIPCVLGYMPGSDYDLAGELVVVFASYDGLGTDADGTVFPGANHNASSIGVMLEIARLWNEQGLDARRSVLFVAWGGGQLDGPGAEAFLQDSTHFRHLPAAVRNKPTLLFQLDRLGAGGQDLLIHSRSNPRLAALVEGTAGESGVSVRREEFAQELVGRGISWVYLAWSGDRVPLDQDTIARIEPEKLQAVGEPLALALTTVIRQTTY
jgi:peptide/nickel transport system permease protein